MNSVYLVYCLLGTTVLVLALAAEPIKEYLWLSSPMIAMITGFVAGPHVTGLVDTTGWTHQTLILEELAYLTLAISLMGIAFRLPDIWIRQKWRPLVFLLLLGMPAMWLLSALCGWFILDLPILEALLLGSLLTPTDPVVADSIVTGELAEKNIDADIRHLISAESGANDGLAYLLVMIPALLLKMPLREAVLEWTFVILLADIGGSVLGGILIGYLTAKGLKCIYNLGHTQHESILAVTLALALSLLGAGQLLHGNGIVAVFTAGLTMNWQIRKDRIHEEGQHQRIQLTIKQFFEVPLFLFFGMIVPVQEWFSMGTPLLVFALAILLLRRLPVFLLLHKKVKTLNSLRDALFVGWFGPIGAAAMVYATWAEIKEGYELLWIVASLVIFTSVLIHGITATPLTRLYASANPDGSSGISYPGKGK